MQLLKEIRNPDVGLPNKPCIYKERLAARAIIRRGNKIAFQFLGRDNYYKLPGGGVENNESLLDGLSREVREEVGCEIRVLGEVGQIIEYRDDLELKQTSCCYLAELVGEVGEPALTESEIDEEMKSFWIEPDEALRLIKANLPETYEGKFIVMRDAIFLEAAIKLL